MFALMRKESTTRKRIGELGRRSTIGLAGWRGMGPFRVVNLEVGVKEIVYKRKRGSNWI